MENRITGNYFTGNDLGLKKERNICHEFPNLCKTVNENCTAVCTTIEDCFKCTNRSGEKGQRGNVKGTTHPEGKT